jgi:AcrR family transcriptional regulator
MAAASTESTRERLLSSAEALFAEKGFEGTSVRELAARAGCNLSLIHYYFGSKEGLLTELVRSKAGQAGALLEAAAAEAPDAPAAVRAFVAFMIDFATENQAFLRMVFREVIGTPHPAFDAIRGRIQLNLGILDGLLAAGQDAGQLRAVDRPVAAMGLAGMTLFYFLALPLTSSLLGPPTPELRERLRATLTDLYLHGILGDDRSPGGTP